MSNSPDSKSTILVTGSNGMVGKALVSRLQKGGFSNLLTPRSKDLDLRDQNAVMTYFDRNHPAYVIHLAGRVGGIKANIDHPAEFLYDNMMMVGNIAHAARSFAVEKMLFLGSSCIYPRDCEQPMKEESLLTGRLEPTNEGYALAKICGLKLMEYCHRQYGSNFMSLLPCNIYGPHDHFGVEGSHVISALIHKFHQARLSEASEVEVWGTGKSRREFLFVDDVAEAIVYFFKGFNAADIGSYMNIGSGMDLSIAELADAIREVVGFKGSIRFNPSYPDGMPRKLLDVSRAEKLGWSAKIRLHEGLKRTYSWYLENGEDLVGTARR